MPFSVPRVWREQKDHSSNCHFCFTNITGIMWDIRLPPRSRREVTLLAASSGNYLTTFRYNLSIPSSRVKNLFGFLTLEDGADRKNVVK
jgi:hypothetical protein